MVFLILELDIRLTNGFSALLKTDGVYLRIPQNRKFPKSMSRSVCINSLVRNEIKVA